MTSLGDMRKHISAVVEEANAQGLGPRDVIPDEVQAQCQDLNELNKAQEYIKEADAREANLKVQLAESAKKLQEAEQAVKDMPDDHKQRLQDFQLANTRADFYTNLYREAEERALNFQQKWNDALAKQTAFDSVQLRVETLQQESKDQKSIIAGLITTNRSLQSMVDTVRSTHEKAIEAKVRQLKVAEQAKRDAAEDLKEQKKKYQALDCEHEVFEDTVKGLVDDLELQSAETAVQLNTASARKRNLEQLHMTILIEMKSLRRAFTRCSEMLVQYTPYVQSLVDAAPPGHAMQLLDTHRASLRAADDELEAFDGLRASMVGQTEDEVRHELGITGKSAHALRDTLVGFAEALTRASYADAKPGYLNIIKSCLGSTGSPRK